MAYTPKPGLDKLCSVCKKPFRARWTWQMRCSKTCTRSLRKSSTCQTEDGNKIATSTVGAIGELLAASDLLKKGYEVFRSVSASSSCDLMAIKDGKAYRFEVKTKSVTKYVNSQLKPYDSYNLRAENLIFIIYQENAIIYKPEQPTPFSL